MSKARRLTLTALMALAVSTAASAPVWAVEFGDDTSRWANDGQCDDPRFAGEGVDEILSPTDLMKDATDCRTLFEAGKITLAPDAAAPAEGAATPPSTGATSTPPPSTPPATGAAPTPPSPPTPPPGPAPAAPAPAETGIAFGDNTSEYANNGECDDGRFIGEGMASVLIGADFMKDAKDCQTLLEAGQISYGWEKVLDAPADLDFGDNSSSFANDGRCDDPRFAGPGMASTLIDQDALHDADDCRAFFEAGHITLAPTAPEAVDSSHIQFGDDASDWAGDEECDDPRFAGDGMANKLNDINIGHDATDCSARFADGQITLKPGAPARLDGPAIDFGTNTGKFSDDGECDDPRFAGPGMASKLDPDNIGLDANDCQALFDAGQIDLAPADGAAATVDSSNVDFGDNTSDYADNGECDDNRFAGTTGMAEILIGSDAFHDAADCRTLFEAGTITYRLVKVLDAPADLDFGTDRSDYARNGECDDPRFIGEGMADVLVDADNGADALDCRTLFEAGQITLNPDGPSTDGQTPAVDGSQVDFGDNESSWANDGECDDPRFAGEGMATTLLDADRLHDADDCRTLFEAGQITLVEAPAAAIDSSAIEFGDNTSQWANDEECDDPRFTGQGMATTLLDADRLHDADDCRALFEAGEITLIETETGGAATAPFDPDKDARKSGTPAAEIDFGDDTSQWAKDGECDDPRFSGQGVAAAPADEDRLHDATDCRLAVESGTAMLSPGA